MKLLSTLVVLAASLVFTQSSEAQIGLMVPPSIDSFGVNTAGDTLEADGRSVDTFVVIRYHTPGGIIGDFTESVVGNYWAASLTQSGGLTPGVYTIEVWNGSEYPQAGKSVSSQIVVP